MTNFQIVSFNVQLGFPVGHSRGRKSGDLQWYPESFLGFCSDFTCRVSASAKTPHTSWNPQPWLPVLVPCSVPCSHNDVLPPSLPSLPRMSWPLCGINRTCWCYRELLLSLGRLEKEWELGGWWEDTWRDTVSWTCRQLSPLMQPYYLRIVESVTQVSFQLEELLSGRPLHLPLLDMLRVIREPRWIIISQLFVVVKNYK